MSRIPTRECPNCGRQYAAASPGCPYCHFVPLKPGRAPWMRWVVLVVGFAGSVVLAFSLRDYWYGDTFWSDMFYAGGTLLFGGGATLMLANKLVGGGKEFGFGKFLDDDA